MKDRKVTAIVLAAGMSRRIRTSVPKILLDLGGQPLIFHILDTLVSLKLVNKIIVVLGHEKESVKKAISGKFSSVSFVVQDKLNGTAQAVAAVSSLLDRRDNTLVICADTPLITTPALRKFINFFFHNNLDCAVITALFKQKSDLGRILRDDTGRIKAIAEKVDVSGERNEEVNSGIYCFRNNELIKRLKMIKMNKKKREFFLTDIINIFYNDNLEVGGFTLKDNDDILGVNTPKSLIRARRILNQRLIEHLIEAGVLIMDPRTTFLSFDTKIGKDSTVYPFTFIEKNVIIGSNCSIGPFIHIRANSIVRDNTKIGNFVEINRSKLGPDVRMKHFGYLGDTEVAQAVNIGAGTVVANYDGKNKHKTKINRNAFLGSDTIIVAPGKIGKGAVTGAGSVVTRPVASNTVVVGVPARVLKKKNR